ncbi:diadenylate cyclase [Flavobacterium sp. ACAM 123]|jgi:hypothetical protein|uniref:diadenylate cyclase n=1 Tax=Flavobacterium sp. ACAM 123 TaxID=1189620 RepID=UPI0003790854|nr:diadenylate cyclase [Flavobacterium sp. ACAM 123]
MKNYKIIDIVDKICENKYEDFTGLGLIFYIEKENLPIESLNPFCELNNQIMDEELIAQKLVEISKETCQCHDGFHLLNQDCNLTDLSYYFSTPISIEKKPKQNNGSRYRTAFYGSLLTDVILTVIISSNYNVMIFIKGEEFNLYEYKKLT